MDDSKLNLILSSVCHDVIVIVCHLQFYAKAYTEHTFGAERTNILKSLSGATKHGPSLDY